MSTPFDPRPLPLTDADREVWAEFEAANRRAVYYYRAYSAPEAVDAEARPSFHDCAVCGTPTRARLDRCRGCARAEREAGA